MNKYSYLAAAWWGILKHPDGKQIRIICRFPLRLRIQKQDWDGSIAFCCVLREPFRLWVPPSILSAYGEAVLGDRYWDIPF